MSLALIRKTPDEGSRLEEIISAALRMCGLYLAYRWILEGQHDGILLCCLLTRVISYSYMSHPKCHVFHMSVPSTLWCVTVSVKCTHGVVVTHMVYTTCIPGVYYNTNCVMHYDIFTYVCLKVLSQCASVLPFCI